MVAQVITYRMSVGPAGHISRGDHFVNQPEQFNGANGPTLYGQPVRMVAGKPAVLAAGVASADIWGFTVRPYPQQSASNDYGDAIPPTTQVGDVMRAGYMLVRLRAGTAVKGGVVHIRIATPTAQQPIGGVEAAADGANTVQIPAHFMGAADANGITEIGYRIGATV